jgi:hypothetical protein
VELLNPFAITGVISLGLWLVLLAAKAFALIDALRHKPGSFVAAGKQSKQLWLILTGLGLAFHMITNPLSLLNVAGTIIAIVFLVDVRPALQQVTGRGGGSVQGPYGPW